MELGLVRPYGISGAGLRTVDRCSTDTALNVTLRALPAVAYIVTPKLLGPSSLGRDGSRADRALASCIVATPNTIYEPPTCPPVDGGPTDSQSITQHPAITAPSNRILNSHTVPSNSQSIPQYRQSISR